MNSEPDLSETAAVAPGPCRTCGVCCFSQLEAYVRVTGDDWARLGPEAGERAHFIGHRAFMRMRDGHCAALEIRRRPNGTSDFYCTLYDRRPQVCRTLERGSPECWGELDAKSVRVAQAIE